MSCIELPAISTEYLFDGPLIAFDPDNPDAAVDITTLPVSWAFVTPGIAPISGDWHDGEWTTDDTRRVRILVGPDNGGLVLAAGHMYDVWVRITGTVEEPKRHVGAIKIV